MDSGAGPCSKWACLCADRMLGLRVRVVTIGVCCSSGRSGYPCFRSVRRLGVAAVIAQAALAAWLCEGFLGMHAQHLRGPLEVRRGVAISLQKIYSARAVCKAYLNVRIDRHSGTSSTCLVTSQWGSVSKVTPSVGERVDIHLRKTALGFVVIAVEPVRSRPAG